MSCARVIKLNTDVNGKIKNVIFSYKNKNIYKVKGSIFILACSGLGTPRLLLNSKNKYFPDGIANSSGLVGKNLMLHPLGYIEGTFKNYLGSNTTTGMQHL